MFYLIETKEQLKEFDEQNFKEAFLHIVPLNDNFHPSLTHISLIYVRPFLSHKGYILCIDTDESFKLKLDDVIDVLSKFDKLCVLDKKETLYYLPFEEILYDLKLLKQDIKSPELNIYNVFYKWYPSKHDVNKLIPISKHYEYCELLYNEIQTINYNTSSKWYKFYNTYAIPSFYLIEQNGITIDAKMLNKHFDYTDLSYSVFNNKIYTKYNLYNITSRPSNAFNNINFGALNKENGCRALITHKNDYLVEMDFDSFHVRLLGELVGYTFDEGNIHEFLGKLYFDVETLTPEQYKQSKEKTFQILYTDVNLDKYQHIKFFKLVKDYKNKMWAEYKQNGFINAPLSSKPLTQITSKTQILPYLLQNYETETNIVKIYKIQRLLHDKTTKLIFYSYDALLFDVSKEDGNELINEIKMILEDNKFPVKIKFGKDYSSLKATYLLPSTI